MARRKFCLLIDRLVQGNKVKIKKMVTIFILICILNEILEQFISIFFVCMKQFRYFEKATKFEKISHFLSKLLSSVKTVWEIFFSNFCDLLRIPELYFTAASFSLQLHRAIQVRSQTKGTHVRKPM